MGLESLVPDEIEIFRALRGAGRSDREKMKAIDAMLNPLRIALMAPASEVDLSDRDIPDIGRIAYWRRPGA